MDTLFARYRNLVVLLALLVAQLAGLAVQVHRNRAGVNTLDGSDPGGVRLIRLWADAVVSPPERLIHWTKTGCAWTWANYLDLRHVREQNQQLQKTVDRLRLEQAALLEDARQGQRLQAMLGFEEKYIYATVAAQVFGSGGSDRSHVFYIDKGADNGLKPDMAVITTAGIVGKVRDVFPHTAQVLAVNDPSSGAGVILEKTRIRGILKGDAEGRLEVVGILADERIQPGEKVLTAGGDQIFPRGLPAGVVEKIVRDPVRDGFIDVYIRPEAQLDGLDEVLVITSMQPRFPAQEQQDITASATEENQVPDAIKDQMKAAEIMAEKLPSLTDPNLPADQQPLNDNTNPNSPPQPPQPLHPDAFSPPAPVVAPAPQTTPATEQDSRQSAAHTQPQAQPQTRPLTGSQTRPRRNP